MARLFTFKREISLDVVAVSVIAIIPLAIVMVQDHFRLATLDRDQTATRAIVNKVLDNQEQLAVKVERIGTLIESHVNYKP